MLSAFQHSASFTVTLHCAKRSQEEWRREEHKEEALVSPAFLSAVSQRDNERGLMLLLTGGLCCDGCCSARGCFGIAQIVVADRPQRFIKLVNERNAGGNIQLDDLVLGHVVEIFHQCAQTVSVRRDDDTLTRFHGRGYRLVPVRKKPRDGVFQ